MKSKRIGAVLGLCVAVAAVIVQVEAQNQAPASSAGPQLRQTAYIKASNAEAADHFGCGGALDGHTGNSVAISADGNTLAVGAHQESSNARTVNGNQNNNAAYASGAVYVFTRTATGWAQQAYIKTANAGQSDNFGSTVVLSADGNTLAAAALWESSASKGVNSNANDDSLPQAGAAYVFSRTGTTWTQQAYLKASNTGRAPTPGNAEDWGDGDQFGFSIAISGDGNTVAVGAISEDSTAAGINTNLQNDDSANSAGAVYVYTRTGTAWSQQAYVKAANSEAGDLFGYNVGLSADGNTMAVAGYDEDGSAKTPNGIPDNRRGGSGAIYVFTRDGANWRQSAYLKGSKSEQGDSLGYAVVISEDGNTIAAGAADEDCYIPGINPVVGCDDDRVSNTSTGGAYVWGRTGNNWAEQAYIKHSNPGLEDWFGARMALSGDGNTLAISAALEDSIGQGINPPQNDDLAHEAGAVYFFTREGTTWTQRAFVKASNNEAFDEFGSALALSRDGKTMVVGARGEDSNAKGMNGNQRDNSASEAGAVYVFSYN